MNKAKKVSNANYLWLSYFYSYLNENGRAGVVMSSQASSAGRDEAIVRQKIDRDRRGRCDDRYPRQFLLHAHRALPAVVLRPREGEDEARRDHVLMLDARNIFRKVSRSVCDFSPEQQKNIAAIVWLYRGQQDALPEAGRKLSDAGDRGRRARRHAPLAAFEEALGKLVDLIEPFAKTEARGRSAGRALGGTDRARRRRWRRTSRRFVARAAAQAKHWPRRGRDNAGLNAARAGAASAGGALPRSDQADRPCRRSWRAG